MGQVKIYPYIRKDRLNSEGKAPIIIRFDLDGIPAAFDNLNKWVPVSEWNNQKRLVSDNYPNATYINAIIKNRLNKHENFLLKREAFGMPITRLILKWCAASKAPFDFLSYAEYVIENKRLKDDQPYSEDTKRRYRDEIKRIGQFHPNVEFHQITPDWLVEYRIWLKETYQKKDGKPLEKNSIWKALSFVQMVYKYAIKKQIVLAETDPFVEFSVGGYETNHDKIKYLEIQEVDALEKTLTERTDLPEMTTKVGWRYLAMCVSGMRISDAMRLNEFYFNSVGDLEFNPHKTRRHNNTATIPLRTDRQRRYFARTMRDQFPETDPKNFRTTFNHHLKVLAAAAGIRLDITSHSGRHTMGGLLVDAGVETSAKKAIMGVKSSKTLDVYSHLKQDKLNMEADKLGNIM